MPGPDTWAGPGEESQHGFNLTWLTIKEFHQARHCDLRFPGSRGLILRTTNLEMPRSKLVGHSSTRTTERVYRHELRPVPGTGAGRMSRILSQRS